VEQAAKTIEKCTGMRPAHIGTLIEAAEGPAVGLV
jgi:hypothetical protein